jgi:2-keto-3-deoxy-L-rhamnonate aldolase RhmA
MIRNTFRDKLNEGLPTVGTHFMLTDPDVVELIGGVGYFDYGEFTAEYSAFDLPHLYHLGRAGDAAALPLMVKPDQASQAFVAQGALGAGFHVLLLHFMELMHLKESC